MFDKTTAGPLSPDLTFQDSQDHHDPWNVVTSEINSVNIDVAWRTFFTQVEDFISSAIFQTTSYIAFHDWNHLIINKTKKLALLSLFERSFGTTLSLYKEEEVEDINKLIHISQKDERLKNFLHCYRMAVLVDAPETQDAYEKYLILAAESLAGGVEGDGRLKYNRKRLQQIVGKDLHKYFFSHIDPVTGKTIRNANMHDGKSPNDKPSETLKIVNRLREFVAKEYGLKSLTMLEEKNSPTRGYYRDDGGRIALKGEGVIQLNLFDIRNINDFMKKIPKNIQITTFNTGEL